MQIVSIKQKGLDFILPLFLDYQFEGVGPTLPVRELYWVGFLQIG